MAIYTTNNTPYKGRSLQDMLVPYLMYTQRYDDIANKMADLGDQSVIWNNLLSPTLDKNTYETVSQYNQRLGDVITQMQNGDINLNKAMSELQNMRREYNSWGTAVNNAYNRRRQLADEQRQLEQKGWHFTQRADSTSIDDFIDNPEWSYSGASENDVYAHALAGSKGVSSRKITFAESKAFQDEYYRYTKIQGMSGVDAIKTIADLHNFPELKAIYDRVNSEFGLNRWQLGSFDRESLDASALSGILDGITYDVDVQHMQNHHKIAEINHSYDKPSNNNGNGEDPYEMMQRINDFVSGTFDGIEDNTTSEQSIQTNNLFRQLQSNSGSNEALFNSQDESVRGSRYNNQPFYQYNERDANGNLTGYGYAMSKDMQQYQMQIDESINWLNEFQSAYDNTINHSDYYGERLANKNQRIFDNWQSSLSEGVHEYGNLNEPQPIVTYDNNGNKRIYSFSDYKNARNLIYSNKQKIDEALKIENELINQYSYLIWDDDETADILNKIYHLEQNINKNKQYVIKSFDQSFADSQTFAKIFLDRFNKLRNDRGDVGLFKIDNSGKIDKSPTNLTYKEEGDSSKKHNYEVGFMNSPLYKGMYISVDGEKYIGKGDIDFDYSNAAIENYNKFLNDFSKDHMLNQYIDLTSYGYTVSDLENYPEVARRILTYDKQNRSSISKNDQLLQYYVVKDDKGNYWKIITDNNKNIVGKLSVTDAISGNFYESNSLQNDFNNMMFLSVMNSLKPDIKPN